MTPPARTRYATTAKRLKELRKLDQQVARRVVAAIAALEDNPRPAGCRVLVGYPHLLRIRVGDYRVIDILQNSKLINLVLRLAHRREVYRAL